MKKILSCVLAVAMLAGLGVYAYAAAGPDVEEQAAPIVERSEDSYTMGELQEMLMNWLESNGYDLELGTQEFYDFTLAYLIDGAYPELNNHPQHSMIGAYMAHYKVTADDACWAALIAENEGMSEEERFETYFTFYETEEFLNTTIGQIKENVAQQNAECEAIMAERQAAAASENDSRAISFYHAGNAARYAIRYAKDYNSSYPRYDGPFQGGDCTNFISQAVHAGGVPMVGDPGSVANTNTDKEKWYCYISPKRVTTTWISAGDFNGYMSYIAESMTSYTYASSVMSACKIGDVVQLCYPSTGEPYHSIMITQKNSATDVAYCGHTSDRVNEPFTSINDSENTYILIHFNEL